MTSSLSASPNVALAESELCTNSSSEEQESESFEDITEKILNAYKKKIKVRRIKQPCILIFDSLRTKSRAKVAATLREYLHCEYKSKIGDKERNFSVENLPGCCPKVPQQDNSSDCGVYLLQYIESFFENPLHTYELPYFEEIETPGKWFLAIL